MVFIETTIFTRQIMELVQDSEYRELQNELLLNPKAGSVIQGGGGLRKIRLGARGRGKSGGIRIIYYHQTVQDIVYFLLA